jgi:hypothetical protein
MYQSRDATDAVDLITTTENAKEKFSPMHRKPQPKTVHSCTNRTEMHKLHGVQKTPPSDTN